MTIYERIRALRINAGMSQEELAKKVGLKSRSSINKIELGQRDISQTKIKLFADALGVSCNYLMDGGEAPETVVIDEDSRELLDRVRHSDGMRMLFSVTKDCTEEDIQTAIKIIKALRDESHNN